MELYKKPNCIVICLLLLFLVCTSLTGCTGVSPEKGNLKTENINVTAEDMEKSTGIPVVTILLDTPLMPARWNQITSALESCPGFEKDFNIYVEKLPYEGVNRSTEITRIRTEIMAGKGPDLFLCGSGRDGLWGSDFASEPFFRFPEQAMNNHVFLQLDEYIESAEYMEWDEMIPQVMEAGRNEEGQMILPMAYSTYMTFFDKNIYTPTSPRPSFWDDMIKSDDVAILCSARDRQPHIMGQMSDFSKDIPLISEDELLMRTKEYYELLKLEMDGTLDKAPEHYSGALNRTKLMWQGEQLKLDDNSPEYHIIPAYNIQGGVTADISVFAAINRNARHPDLAFKVVDHLLSKKIQQNSSFYSELFEGFPVYIGLGSKDFPLDGGWYMSDANFMEFQAVQEQINQVKFPGPVDVAVWDIKTYAGISEDALTKNVHEQYVLMEMLLAES